jgi:hypothetical protein
MKHCSTKFVRTTTASPPSSTLPHQASQSLHFGIIYIPSVIFHLHYHPRYILATNVHDFARGNLGNRPHLTASRLDRTWTPIQHSYLIADLFSKLPFASPCCSLISCGPRPLLALPVCQSHSLKVRTGCHHEVLWTTISGHQSVCKQLACPKTDL